MSKFVDFIKGGLRITTIDPDSTKDQVKPSKVTNKVLLKELSEHFNEQMEELSVGKRLLYPMSFNILMHPDDYNTTKESLPFVLPEVVAEFYASIKRKRDAFNCNVNYAPPATYWFFQFSACQIGVQDGKEDFIQRGKIVTTGSLTTFDIQKAKQGNIRQEANVHLSVKCQNSNTNDNNINMDALLGMEILSEGAYTFNFDKNLSEDTTNIIAASDMQRKGWATLRWAAEGGNNNVYDMYEEYIEISNYSDPRPTRNIVKIKHDAISRTHALIKYDKATQTFVLAAYAKTRLNSREVPLSSGSSPVWVTLPKFNSKIFLNDTVSIEFNANSDLV